MQGNLPGALEGSCALKWLPVLDTFNAALKGSYTFLEFNDSDDSNLVATKRYKRYLLYREQ